MEFTLDRYSAHYRTNTHWLFCGVIHAFVTVASLLCAKEKYTFIKHSWFKSFKRHSWPLGHHCRMEIINGSINVYVIHLECIHWDISFKTKALNLQYQQTIPSAFMKTIQQLVLKSPMVVCRRSFGVHKNVKEDNKKNLFLLQFRNGTSRREDNLKHLSQGCRRWSYGPVCDYMELN